jgi:hypothetical protein
MFRDEFLWHCQFIVQLKDLFQYRVSLLWQAMTDDCCVVRDDDQTLTDDGLVMRDHSRRFAMNKIRISISRTCFCVGSYW